jgi:exosome complex component RRP42
VCFADGTEAVVGVKAEVEKSANIVLLNENQQQNSRQRRRRHRGQGPPSSSKTTEEEADGEEEAEDEGNGGVEAAGERHGENDWLELSVEIPGYRDDDSSTVFLATMLSEALRANGELTKMLWINRRFHWKLYLDVSFACLSHLLPHTV